MSSTDDEIDSKSLDWIFEHCASNQNSKMLCALFNDLDFAQQEPFSSKTNQLIQYLMIRRWINSTSYEQLMPTFLQQNNIFSHYHQLYPASICISNKEHLLSLSKSQQKKLTQRLTTLFQNEIELKVQIILSTNYWKQDYVEHKKLTDTLLHQNHYIFDEETTSNLEPNAFIPEKEVICYINHCANGLVFIHRIHQQLNYLGQQCTKPSINLHNNHDENVQKINQFLDKHSFNRFQTEFIKMLDIERSRFCRKGKDFLSRLARADIHKILDIPRNISHESPIKTPIESPKYALRTVVDVKVRNNWCPGTIIQRFDDGSLNIALHADALDESGRYQYDVHYKARELKHVVLCINDDGEIETDENPELLIDTNTNVSPNCLWSSPIKQQQIREKKQLKLSQQRQEFSQVLANRKRKSEICDAFVKNLETDYVMLSLSDEDKKEGQKKKNDTKKERRRKRIREEFEENETQSNPSKRRKIVTRSMTRKEQKGNEGNARRSPRLAQKQRDKILRERKTKKKKIQTKITATKDKQISFAKHMKKKDQEADSGEEQRWSDDMSEDMKKLNGKQTKESASTKRTVWKKEDEEALEECYKKHDKMRKKVNQYAIWEHIKRDPDYCKHWKNRSTNSIRDKARVLLGLNKLKKK